MIVTCKQCATRFHLDGGRVKPSGTKVRCSNCQSVFRVYPAPGEPAPAGPGLGSAAGAIPSALAAVQAEGMGPAPEEGRLPGRMPSVGEAPAAVPPVGEAAGGCIELEALDVSEMEKTLGLAFASGSAAGGRSSTEGPARTFPEDEPPLTFDLEDLEIGPDIDQPGAAEPAAVSGFGAPDFSLEETRAPASAADAALELESVDSWELEDILDSLAVENAPVGEEVPDIESFDLLADDASGKSGAAGEAFFAEAKGADDLDPAEIEALLDMEGAPEAPAAGAPEEGAPEEEGAGGGDALRGAEKGDTQAPAGGKAQVAAAAEGPGAAPDKDDDLNLDQLSKMIALEEASLFGTPPEESAAPEDGGDIVDGIDLAEIERLLDQEIAADAAREAEGEGSGEELELGFDLDGGEPPAPAPALQEAGPVLGLAGEGQRGGAPGDAAPRAGAPEAAGSPAGEPAEPGDEGALDFSDIEKLLEDEMEASGFPEEEEPQDLELVLGFPPAPVVPGLEAEAAERGGAPAWDMPADAVASLLEPADAEATDAETFDLDLDIEEIPEEFGGASVILEGEDGLELETLNALGEKPAEGAHAAEPGKGAGTPPPDRDAGIFEMGANGEDFLLPEEMGGELAAVGASPGKPRGRRRVRLFLWVLLILALLGGGGYAAFKFIDPAALPAMPGIALFDRFLKKDSAGEGVLKVELAEVSSRFVTKAGAGVLFVVSGRARNGYDHPRSYLEVKGVINARDGKPVRSQRAYCGNILSDKDLEGLDPAAIQARLNNRAGANRSNLGVAPGRSVPFMLVFWDLPADLGEFSVEPAGSAPAN